MPDQAKELDTEDEMVVELDRSRSSTMDYAPRQRLYIFHRFRKLVLLILSNPLIFFGQFVS